MKRLEAQCSKLKSVVICGAVIVSVFSYGLPASSADKWQGVDEAVVQKVAAEHGRQGRSLLGLEGDLQLFAFLMAGAVGGFVAGYFWRMLLAERKGKASPDDSTNGGAS